ncbi:hypothetical protein FOL47_008193 [Perkinsus chesapeaki]|uniref:Uncharacterized protein n=1 Tax=Perkinsus chesapeaki TaxID=330153 RepID=A0A7J6LG13_PERCH|nr:hypothetical protein FOL47_008193 [Perkinsus chesapeaki]
MRRRELQKMAEEDSLVLLHVSLMVQERRRMGWEDGIASRCRQWEAYQLALEAQQRELAFERRAMKAADNAAREWIRLQHLERNSMVAEDDHSAAQRMEDRREMEGRRMMRAMHESRAYRIYLKAVRRNRCHMAIKDAESGELRECYWMSDEEAPSLWWRKADGAVTTIARGVRRRRDERRRHAARRLQALWRGYHGRLRYLTALEGILKIQSCFRGSRCRISVKAEHTVKHSAAVKIQAVFRGHRQFQRYQRVHSRPLSAVSDGINDGMGEVDLSDIIEAEERISSLFSTKIGISMAPSIEAAGAASLPDVGTRVMNNNTNTTTWRFPPLLSSADQSPHSRPDTTASSQRSFTPTVEMSSSGQVVALPPIAPNGGSAIAAWRTPTPSVHHDEASSPNIGRTLLPKLIAKPTAGIWSRPHRRRIPNLKGVASWTSPVKKQKHPLNAQESVRVFMEQQQKAEEDERDNERLSGLVCCLALASAAESADAGFGSAVDVTVEERALDLMATVVEKYVAETVGATAAALATASNRHEIGVMDIAAASNFSRSSTADMSGAINRRLKRKCQIELINPATGSSNKRPNRGSDALLECPQLTGDEITRSLLCSPRGLIPQALPQPSMPTIRPDDNYQTGKGSDDANSGPAKPLVPAHFPSWLNREIVKGYTELQKNISSGKLQPDKKGADENEKTAEAKAFAAAVQGKTEKADSKVSESADDEQADVVKGERVSPPKRPGVGRIRIAR